MAIKGLSIPVFGRYNYNPKTKRVTYTNGMINPAIIEYTLTPESTDGNPLYGNNQIIENDSPRFNGGTLSLGVDDLVQEVSKYLLGIKIVEKEINGKMVEMTVFDDSQSAPFLGTGLIEEHQIRDKNRYKAVIIAKVKYDTPENAATTRGETIEWQTKTLNGNVLRSEEVSDTANFPWKYDAWFDAESEALEFLQYMLGVGTIGELTLTAAEGTEAGKTLITVSPEKAEGNTYRYMVGTQLELPLPEYNADCSDMAEWNGTEEIQAAAGDSVMIVECSGYNARKAAIVTAVIKEGE